MPCFFLFKLFDDHRDQIDRIDAMRRINGKYLHFFGWIVEKFDQRFMKIFQPDTTDDARDFFTIIDARTFEHLFEDIHGIKDTVNAVILHQS